SRSDRHRLGVDIDTDAGELRAWVDSPRHEEQTVVSLPETFVPEAFTAVTLEVGADGLQAQRTESRPGGPPAQGQGEPADRPPGAPRRARDGVCAATRHQDRTWPCRLRMRPFRWTTSAWRPPTSRWSRLCPLRRRAKLSSPRSSTANWRRDGNGYANKTMSPSA